MGEEESTVESEQSPKHEKLQAHLNHAIRKPSVSVIINSGYNPVNGFIDFLREHAIVGLAIGFVIGTQVQSLVKQLVTSFIDPLFQLFLGESLTSKQFIVTNNGHTAAFPWGSFVYAMLDFLFVVAAIYIIVKVLKLDKLDKPVLTTEHKKIVDKVLDEIDDRREEKED